MMPPGKTITIGGSQIIRTECGRGTGDRIHVTADGTRWLEVSQRPNSIPTGGRHEPMKEHRDA